MWSVHRVELPAGRGWRVALDHAARPATFAEVIAVGDAMVERVNDHPVWLSTAGAGVPWLHVRLDDRPKYYGHAAYCTPPGGGT